VGAAAVPLLAGAWFSRYGVGAGVLLGCQFHDFVAVGGVLPVGFHKAGGLGAVEEGEGLLEGGHANTSRVSGHLA
jgi:hypothetical protein